jgi:multidrug efflux pump subunit AcrB
MASKLIVFPAPGFSMGDVMRVIDSEMVNLPKGYDYDWYGTSYQQRQSQTTSGTAFLFSIIMIYLVLAALYEMWRLPLVVMLGIPCALFGSAIILLLSGKNNDLYFQISLIALLGLSAKNIILLVEFALQQFRAGHSAAYSALTALSLRFRPIVMTSVTFIFGTLPLVFASGAGANAQHSVGMGIIGGILGSVLIGTLLTPAFFTMLMKSRKDQ